MDVRRASSMSASTLDTSKTKRNSENVKVIIRCRPMTSKEKNADYTSVVKVSTSRKSIQIWDPKKPNDAGTDGKVFTFDAVYGCNTNQELLYRESVRPLVESVLNGYNATVFAYGQTGTGKTYTMEGIEFDDRGKGLMPRSFDQIFDHVGSHPEEQYVIYCSYLQLYQDEIKDLLGEPGTKTCELKGDQSSVYIKNLNMYECKTAENMYKIMKYGNRNRKTSRTDMNEASSRSHAIFTIAVQISKTVQGLKHVKLGKLNLVDLAGSERHNKSHSTGQLLKEAAKINLSLTALGKVISALTNEKPTHIPYRDSKLTKLLQDSLGGNAKTLMIANIGPASDNYIESLNTLNYATRAKHIKNKPLMNEHYTKDSKTDLQEQDDCQEPQDDDPLVQNDAELYCGGCGVPRPVCELCGSKSFVLRVASERDQNDQPEADEAAKALENNVFHKVFDRINQMKKEKYDLESKRDMETEGSRAYNMYDVRCYRKDLEIGITMYQTFRYMIEKKFWNVSEQLQDESKRDIEKMIDDYNVSVKNTKISDEMKKQLQYPVRSSVRNEIVTKVDPHYEHPLQDPTTARTIDTQIVTRNFERVYDKMEITEINTEPCKMNDPTVTTKEPVFTTMPYFYGRKTVEGRRDTKFRDDVTVRVNSCGIKQYYIGDNKLSNLPGLFPDDPPARESKFKENVTIPQSTKEPLFKYLGNNRFLWNAK